VQVAVDLTDSRNGATNNFRIDLDNIEQFAGRETRLGGSGRLSDWSHHRLKTLKQNINNHLQLMKQLRLRFKNGRESQRILLTNLPSEASGGHGTRFKIVHVVFLLMISAMRSLERSAQITTRGGRT
jgi:hypothetical protein